MAKLHIELWQRGQFHQFFLTITDIVYLWCEAAHRLTNIFFQDWTSKKTNLQIKSGTELFQIIYETLYLLKKKFIIITSLPDNDKSTFSCVEYQKKEGTQCNVEYEEERPLFSVLNLNPYVFRLTMKSELRWLPTIYICDPRQGKVYCIKQAL